MSLHGTLETFALPDVLALLAATKKTGELRVVGGKTDGRVWFDAGAVVGTEVGRAAGYVDAVFELLRLESGKFSFDAEKSSPAAGDPGAVDALLTEAQARLEEWRSIEAVVPSVACGVSLASEVDDPHVMVTGDQWRALVGVASAGTVSTLIDHLGAGEFETCRTLKGLVEAGLVRVGEAPAVAPEPVAVQQEAPKPEPEPEVVAETPEPEVVAQAPEPEVQPEAVEVRIEALVVEPEPTPARSKIQALTSTPAASAAALEAEMASDARGDAAAVPSKGEADELVRQVAAFESAGASAESAPAPAAESTPAPSPEPEPEVPSVAEAPAAEAPPAPGPAAPATPDAPGEGEEPINRGLLLKFLSSVRT